jgi:translocation and assembly module TamB
MKRLTLYLGCALLVILVLVLGGMYWLVGTTPGARFALTGLPLAGGMRITVRAVEGRLWDHLRLTGLRLERPQLSVEVDRVDLAWQPSLLQHRDLSVSELALSGVRIQDDQPPSAKAPEVTWPRVSGLARSFSARVSSFKVSDLSYRHQQSPPVRLGALSSSLTYRDGLLTLSGLSATAPQGRVTGELVAGLASPSLRLDLALVPTRPVQGMDLDLLSLQARLLAGQAPEIMAGTLAVAGRKGGAQRLELTGELGMTRTSFLLRRLNLARPGERGSLTGTGSLTLTKGEPLIALELQGSDLDLRDQLKQATRLSGTLSFSGSPSSYRGRFALENRGPGWQTGALAGDYRGDLNGLSLGALDGKLLQGRLGGRLDLAWSQGFRASGSLTGRGLNPGQLAPDWSGRVNLDLAGELELPKGGKLRGKLNGKLLESRLHGKELQGEVVAAFAGERLRLDRLTLRGKGFNLQGAGELDRRINLVARVDDLSRLVPGAAGTLQADAWVRWRKGRLAGGATGQGQKLVVAGVRAAGARLNARLSDEKGYPVHLEAALNGLGAGRMQADSALLKLDGNAARHSLSARLSAPHGEAQALLTGGYANGVWRGEISQLSGHDDVGPWSLAAPAPLMMSAERLVLAPLALVGTPSERAGISGDLRLHPLAGALQGNWSGINLARANSWLSGMELSGASSGDLSLQLLPGERLILKARALAQGTLAADGRRIGIERLALAADGNGRGLKATLDVALAGGSGEAHLLFDSPKPVRLAIPDQGDLQLQASRLDLALLAPMLPEGLKLEGRLAGLATGKMLPGGRFDLRGNAALMQGALAWHNENEEFDAAFQKAELNFAWRGGKGDPGRLKLAGQAEATGGFTARGERIALERFALRLDADDTGVRAGLDLSLQGGASLRGSLSSPTPAGLALPQTGDFALEWGGIDPVLLKPWLPGALNLKGALAGQAKGRLLPGQRLELEGAAEFSQGRASWQGSGGELNANLRSASLAFAWRGGALTGNLALSLAEYGSAKGELSLPIPARLPVAVDQAGALHGSLVGQVREQGFLTSLFPGLVQESHGELDLDLHLGGIWREPRMEGSLKLAKAGAYLPSAGIRVSDLELAARLEKDQIRIEGFRAVSGGGHLEGAALVRLEGWQVAGYRGTLNGERFQTVYLPEIQLFTSPKLTFEGDGERLAVNGELRVPEMLISGPPTRSVVTPSKDVVLEGAPPAAEGVGENFPLKVEGQIRLVLGDKVQVRAEGIDATLGGEMNLALQGIDSIRSRGEIRVVKGRYRAYGIDLEIVRGRLYYVDAPVDHPTLDILALRTVLDVKAGVTVAGPLGSQVVKLYSEPTMPEVDIMAYMVLGHPLGSGGGDQASLLASAASSLFSFGQSESLQDQIKDRLGLNVLGLQTVDQSSAGRMGYKEVAVSPTGATPKASAGESLLTVGKYLTPKLYLSYGRSLVTGGNLFQLRYDIVRHWQIETQSGSESGADIYYKLEFN